MTELLTAAQMKAIEQAAIDSGEVTGLELMERAGRGVVDAVFEEWPELAATSHRAVVLCGPGNNGGDGFVVARLLKDWGWEVEVFLYGDADKLPPDARVNYERWGETGEVLPLTTATWEDAPFLGICTLMVDALFGTGLGRPVELPLCALEVMPEVGQAHRTVSVDLPSGLCSDSGRVIGEEAGLVVANLTVSFQSLKNGHVLGEGACACGKVIVKDIGLTFFEGKVAIETHLMRPFVSYDEAEGDDEAESDGVGWILYPALPSFEGEGATTSILPDTPVELITKDLISDYLESRQRSVLTHKFDNGHALILSGSSGKTGAARLAARGALRIGAGVVTVGCPPDAITENAAQLNAIMLEAVHDADALARILQDARINALCLGPALGKDARERELVRVALEAKRPTVLDADALSLLQIDEADGLFGLLHENCVLTPHAGEFARLFPDIAAKLNAPATTGPAYSKVDATREAAKRAGCVVLFKGADTVIASPDGRASINSAHYDRAAPWLATAGSGDVLAGFITGLLARGFAPMQAAETAAWLHVECARSFGPGLIAEDLPEALPNVLKSLGV